VSGSDEFVCSLSLLIRGTQRARCQAETPLIALFRFLRPALRPRKSYIEQVVNNVVVNWARERKAELHALGMKNTGANSAEDKAAEEAREALSKLFHNTRYTVPAVGTIKRRMQSTGENSPFFAEDL